MSDATATWHKTVCILCSANCGVEMRLGEDGRTIKRVRGNKAHVASAGYTCEKALRLDHYHSSTGRLTSPLRRRDDGTFEEIGWNEAIAEVTEGLARVGGANTLYYGGGGQGNHLCGAYGAATRSAFGITRKSNALAQEKTGEAWVDGRLFGAHTHGDFHNAALSIFVGKNPWHSHGFDEARRVLKDIASDAGRSMIVIDPRRTETADLADLHLQVVPGTDAFALAAIAGQIVASGGVDQPWLERNTSGHEDVLAVLESAPIDEYTARAGLSRAEIDDAARRIVQAESVAILEDLGVEMAPNSTLVSYLQKLLWILVGAFAKPGGVTTHSSMVPLFSYGAAGREPSAPVTGGPIISGLVPCNEIPAAVLTDHPDALRAMFIESANPVHSLAGSDEWREAMRALEFSVVIDCFMTETAREAHYVLPASNQYEKAETTFFGISFPDNSITLRAPISEPLEGTLPEAEIHSRLARELGIIDEATLEPFREAARTGRKAFADAFGAAVAENPQLGAIGAVALYETLGRTLPPGLEPAAVLWYSAQVTVMKHADAVRAAGHEGPDDELGDVLFDAILTGRDGVVFTRHDYEQAWDLLATSDNRIHMAIPELLAELSALGERPTTHATHEFPFVLSAGERRSFTANTIVRDPAWRKKDPQGALRMSPGDAAALGVETGERIRVTTRGGGAVAVVEVNDTYQDGHIALPNGLGLDYSPAGGGPEKTGVAPNELTWNAWRDEIAGTPWHKHVPARLEPVI